MKKLALLSVLLTLFVASSEAQKRRKESPTKRTSTVKKKSKVKKTTKVYKKPVVRKRSQTPVRNIKDAHVWPRCTSDSDLLNITIYFKCVFTQAVRVSKNELDEQGNWVKAPSSWAGLAEGKVLQALFESLRPDSMEVYPGFAGPHSAMINMIVLERKNWLRKDLQTIELLLKNHVESLGYEFRFTSWECYLPEGREESDKVADKQPMILQ